ncbi:hypothetical protein Hanom_Chr08g00749311 [Helianthus anomalus]
MEVDNKKIDSILEDLSSYVEEHPEVSVDSVVGEEDELEEGEVRSPVDEGGGTKPATEGGGPTIVETELEYEKLHGVVEEGEEMHGENPQPPETKVAFIAT